jgi:hypothetical protein
MTERREATLPVSIDTGLPLKLELGRNALDRERPGRAVMHQSVDLRTPLPMLIREPGSEEAHTAEQVSPFFYVSFVLN